jgi:hypothetical protein
MEIKAHSTPLRPASLTAACKALGSFVIASSDWLSRAMMFPIFPLPEGREREEVAEANLELNTAFMIVNPRVPPKGIAKRISDMAGANRSGHTPATCREAGIKREPVPAPVKTIMPETILGRLAETAQVKAPSPAASSTEPRRSGQNVWPGHRLHKYIAE